MAIPYDHMMYGNGSSKATGKRNTAIAKIDILRNVSGNCLNDQVHSNITCTELYIFILEKGSKNRVIKDTRISAKVPKKKLSVNFKL
jgi:hypothetical protein